MKTSLALVAALLLTGSALHAQNLPAAQVPAAAVAAFRKAYPQVKDVRWEKEKNQFEAGFTQNKIKMSVLLSATGELLETETDMAPGLLPAPVKTKLATQYKGYKVTEAAKIVTAGTGAITYEAEVSRGGKSRDVLFSADGQEVDQ
ncbi:conserved hypothetical protein [Hymenobacter roseosalivarius DSM 11622]|uniref:Uncharacterized protein n=1 Tax=Hymenobacter roseosalivarius DSM 11622 TaxID=645990 RepID=A0A1W1VPG3_9BACT|nr:hypothetical protein [Hymenobacter roseosalivarius]SMB95249.1 conserved hypothetical protein [Hymenobacter roseosalivarius DSM 11622]